jgi:hypothetical protein
VQAPARVTTTTLQAPSKLLRAKDGPIKAKQVRNRTQVWIQRRLLNMAISLHPSCRLPGCVSVMSAHATNTRYTLLFCPANCGNVRRVPDLLLWCAAFFAVPRKRRLTESLIWLTARRPAARFRTSEGSAAKKPSRSASKQRKTGYTFMRITSEVRSKGIDSYVVITSFDGHGSKLASSLE